MKMNFVRLFGLFREKQLLVCFDIDDKGSSCKFLMAYGNGTQTCLCPHYSECPQIKTIMGWHC